MNDIFTFLSAHNIVYERCDHPAVFTCEEAEKLVPSLPGSPTKNLLLRDKKGKRFFLIVVGHDKIVDLKALGEILDIKGLGFASANRLKDLLNVDPGSVTMLGLMFDKDHVVEVSIDKNIWESDAIQCHPLINTSTIIISHEGIQTFLKETGHTPNIIDIPKSRKGTGTNSDE